MSAKAKCTLIHLSQERSIDPKQYFTGAWRSIRLERLEPGQRLDRTMEEIEESYFVLSGSGSAVVCNREFNLYHATTLTFPRGSSFRLDAGKEGLELFVVTLEA